MTKRFLLSAFLLVAAAFAAPASAQEAPANPDPQGFGPFRWGSLKAPVVEFLANPKGNLQALTRREEDGREVLTYGDRNNPVSSFEFHFDKASGELLEVVSISDTMPQSYDNLLGMFMQRLGSPETANRKRGEDGREVFRLVWVFPSTEVALTGVIDAMNPGQLLKVRNRYRKIGEPVVAENQVQHDPRPLLFDPADPVGGNPNGPITIVEFFDYQCGYCKSMAPQLEQLIEGDRQIRFVFKEWAVFGEVSKFAAKVALAANRQGKYDAFHFALMAERGGLTRDTIVDVARSVGLDLVQLDKDTRDPAIAEHLEEVAGQAKTLKFEGTPAFIIGNRLVGGSITLEEMKRMIAELKKALAARAGQ